MPHLRVKRGKRKIQSIVLYCVSQGYSKYAYSFQLSSQVKSSGERKWPQWFNCGAPQGLLGVVLCQCQCWGKLCTTCSLYLAAFKKKKKNPKKQQLSLCLLSSPPPFVPYVSLPLVILFSCKFPPSSSSCF